MSAEKQLPAKGSERALTRLVIRTALLAFIAAVLAAAGSLTLDNEYRAKSALLLSPSPINQPEFRERSVRPDAAPASQISFLMAKPLTAPAYDSLLKNDDIVTQLRAKLVGLLEKASEQDRHVLLEDVRKSIEVRTRVLSKTSSKVEYQPVIELMFTWTVPRIAAEMANEWARLGIELGEQISDKGTEGTIEFLQGRFEDIQHKLEAKEKELGALESLYDIEGLTQRLSDMQTFLTEYEIEEIQLTADIARTQGELDQLAQDLDGIPEKLTLHKAPPDQAYWLLDATQGAPDASKVLASEQVNWLYVTLRENKATLESTLAGLLKQKEAIETQLEQTRLQILALQGTLAEQKRLYGALEREIETYQDQYRRLAVNYEGARIAEAESAPDLKLAYSAAVPEKKVGPHRSLIVFAAALLAALIAPLHFFLRLSLRSYAEALDKAPGSGAG